MISPTWVPDQRLHAFSEVDFGFSDFAAEAAAALNENVIALPRPLAVLAVAGEDSESFLQGQLSNDIREVTATRAQITSWNSAKGRVLTVFTALRAGDQFLLQLPAALAPATLQRLKMFVLRARVRLEDVSGRWQMLTAAGDSVEAALHRIGIATPAEDWACVQGPELMVLRRPGTPLRISIFGTVERLTTLWPALTQALTPVGSAAASLLDILAGEPAIYPATQDQFVAQMLNLDLLKGISFNKGCYTGQEIIARMHYLGNLKKRQFLGYARERAPEPGELLFAAGGDGQAVGTIVQSAPHPTHGYAALAVIQLSAAASASLHLGTENPIRFEIESTKKPTQ